MRTVFRKGKPENILKPNRTYIPTKTSNPNVTVTKEIKKELQ